jgi:hypothetical protein
MAATSAAMTIKGELSPEGTPAAGGEDKPSRQPGKTTYI